jgi:hypothetical protein
LTSRSDASAHEGTLGPGRCGYGRARAETHVGLINRACIDSHAHERCSECLCAFSCVRRCRYHFISRETDLLVTRDTDLSNLGPFRSNLLVKSNFGAILSGANNGNSGGCHEFNIHMGGQRTLRMTRFPSNGYTQFSVAGNFDVHTGYVTSDDRIKFNETTIENALHTIRAMSPQTYDKNRDEMPSVKEAGFIAQELFEIDELRPYVKEPSGETELFAVNYNAIFTYAVAALKELDSIVQSQAKTIASLETRLNRLTSMFDAFHE